MVHCVLASIKTREDALKLQNTTAGSWGWTNFLSGKQHINRERALRAEHPICIYFQPAPPISDVYDRVGINHDLNKKIRFFSL